MFGRNNKLPMKDKMLAGRKGTGQSPRYGRKGINLIIYMYETVKENNKILTFSTNGDRKGSTEN